MGSIVIRRDLKLNVALRYESLYNPRVDCSELAEGTLRVFLVESHPLLAAALARIVEGQSDLALCGTAHTGAEAIADASRCKADVVVIDAELPDMSGHAAAGLIHDQVPGATVVFHNGEESETALLDAIDAGAIAYLTRSATAEQVLEAIRRASLGEVLIPARLFAKALARQRSAQTDAQERKHRATMLTTREREVLSLMGEGFDTIDISKRLGIAAHTTEWHVRHVIEKLEVHSKLQAVIAAARLGLIQVPKP
jgi:DNA-binding NarL/FixJ family response regulator